MPIKKPTIDRNASLASTIMAALGAFGLADKYGITADQVLAVLGLLGTLGAAWRHWQEGKRHASFVETLDAAKRAPAILGSDDDA